VLPGATVRLLGASFTSEGLQYSTGDQESVLAINLFISPYYLCLVPTIKPLQHAILCNLIVRITIAYHLGGNRIVEAARYFLFLHRLSLSPKNHDMAIAIFWWHETPDY
jgi:hypothetical protein